MKRILAILLVSLMLVSSASALEISELGVLPLVNEDVTLTIGIREVANTTDYENNYVTKLLEKETGVKLDFMLFPSNSNEAKQKLSMMVASGEKLPDILFLELSDAERFAYGSSGIFLPLDDYFENQNYYWNQNMDMYGTGEEYYSMTVDYSRSSDGHLYAYPQGVAIGTKASLGMWINKSWCENLGLEIPTTTDELYNVLKAFKEKDANGNGIDNDEIPLIGNTSWTGNAAIELMNSFVYDAFESQAKYQLNVTDGKVWAPFVTEEYHEGLRYLNKLCKEGLLSPLTFSMTQNDLAAIMSVPDDQDTVVGAFVGHPSPLFGSTGMIERVYEYVALPAMIGPEGVHWSHFVGLAGNANTFITCDCEYPDLAWRFLDACARPDLSLSIRYGEEGVDWAFVDGGESLYAAFGYDPVFVQMTDQRPSRWTSDNDTIWHLAAWALLPAKLVDAVEPYPTAARAYQMLDLWYNTIPMRFFNHPDELFLKPIFTEEEIDMIGESEATIRSYVSESLTRFILGDMDVENDWDSYLNELNTMGLDQYIEVCQTVYDRMNK